MRLTDKGLAELAGSPDRRKVSEERVAALGGRSIAFYATLGAYDFVQVFEMPDNEAMMEYVLTARRDGFVDPLILPAFDPATLERSTGTCWLKRAQFPIRTRACVLEAGAAQRLRLAAPPPRARASELRSRASVSRPTVAISRGVSTPAIMNSSMPSPA